MAKRAKAGAALAMVAALTLGGGAIAADKGTVTGVSGAPGAAAPAATAASGPGGLGDAELASLGCAITGGGATAATYVAGPSEAILLLGGGLLVPSSSAILGLSLMAAIGASTCSIGATATPAVLWLYDQSGNLLAEAGRLGGGVVRSVASLFGVSPERPAPRVIGAAPIGG